LLERRQVLPTGLHPIAVEPDGEQGVGFMKDPVYKLIELTGTSTTSVEDAVGVAIKRANKTVKNLRWFQVVETRGTIEKGKVLQWQVTLKVGFAVEE
jgi:dodecin